MPRRSPALSPDFAPPSKSRRLAIRILAAPDTVDSARLPLNPAEPALAWLAQRGRF